MPRLNGVSSSDPEPSGKRKVMIYVPPEVHRAMKQAALNDGERFVSEVYVEAARAFLAAGGISVELPEGSGDVPPTKPASSIADLVVAIKGLGRRVEEVAERAASPRPGAQPPAGTRLADAMKEVLTALREAGGNGLSSREMLKVVQGRGIKSGAEDAAKTVLRTAGLVRCEGRRWYLEGAKRTY